ncbi:glycogen synthase [Gleimia europaea]|uniref:Corynebacterium family glycogen synthase n=1 Tax=Gleimia europaea ACS-120-V-Col10b TaxID=883069 RepID=A0A9W5VW53_9ACTO|nr:glycogen synthase [Gleimia europaea]EPD30573.1 corynebacterium family glycogen synthase [Gleimia europaea ACS-120-V-Col10b]
MRVDLLTREYPPNIYGGAGVHVNELARVLRPMVDLRVHTFDGPRTPGAPGGEDGVTGYSYLPELEGANSALRTFGVDLLMASGIEGTDLVHSHTWYANLGGHLGKLLHDVPHVISAHSLEPLRPWKAEQLGGGYSLSSWAEKTAYEAADGIVAVSNGMRADILRSYPNIDPDRVHVIHNGIDLDEWAKPKTDEEKAAARAALDRLGIDPSIPTVVFVGRITRQKGLPHLLRALRDIPKDAQIVLCAGAPDTPEIMNEVTGLVEELRAERDRVFFITDMLPRAELVAILDAATVFVTPSIYEPLGIVNLEAMAVNLPVVGTATGGIPDVIVDGETGYLVPIEQKQDGTGTPLNPKQFHADLALRLTKLLENPELAAKMGQAGRRRAEEQFAWTTIGERTVELYQKILQG